MNERAKDSAIKHLMVSANGEALSEQQKKKKFNHMLTLLGASTNTTLEIIRQEDGQLSLVI